MISLNLATSSLWERVYIAAIRHGCSCDNALYSADHAVRAYLERLTLAPKGDKG